MPLNKNTAAEFKLPSNVSNLRYIAHAPKIETCTSSLSFKNLVSQVCFKNLHLIRVLFVTKTVFFSGQFTF